MSLENISHENETAEANAAGMDLVAEMERRLRCAECRAPGVVTEDDGWWIVSGTCANGETCCQSRGERTKELAIQRWEKLTSEPL